MLVKKAMHNLNISSEFFDPKLILWKISKFKTENIAPENVEKTDPLSSAASRVYHEYNRYLKDYNAVDFDDILNHTLLLFTKFPEVLKKYQSRYRYLLIDEFQDTNITQYLIVKNLAKESKNIFVVGDDDQSIYGFRGANYENILMFDRDWENCKTIILNVNYRSNKTILDAASSVIKNNQYRKPKEVPLEIWMEQR